MKIDQNLEVSSRPYNLKRYESQILAERPNSRTTKASPIQVGGRSFNSGSRATETAADSSKNAQIIERDGFS